jgi:hypothetical protein
MDQYIPQPSDLIPLIPGAATGLVLLFLAFWLQKKGSLKTAAVAGGLSLGAAHAITYHMVNGLPALPPVQSTERMVYAIALFALLNILIQGSRVKVLLQYGMSAFLVYYLLKPFLLHPPTWATHVSTLDAFLIVGGILLFWTVVEDLSERIKGPSPMLTLALILGLSGQIFLIYGAALLAQLAGTAAIALGLTAVLTRSTLPPAAAGTVTGVAAGIGLDGYYFISETPPALSLLIPAACPLLLYFSLLPYIREMKPLHRFLLQMLLVAIALGIAFYLAVDAMPEAEADPYR